MKLRTKQSLFSVAAFVICWIAGAVVGSYEGDASGIVVCLALLAVAIAIQKYSFPTPPDPAEGRGFEVESACGGLSRGEGR